MSLMDGVKIDIGLNASPFSNGIGSLKHEVSTFEDTIKRVGRTIAGVFGVVGVGATLRQSLQAWNEQEWATKKLEVATARWAQGNKGVMSSIQGLAKEMQRMTGIGDEVWESTGALGLNMGITASKIKDATKAAGILSLVFGYDTNTAMRNLAKTTAGVSGELGEMLPFLRELTTEQLKNGDVIDVIIEKYGDYAEMLSGTSKIATDRFKAAVGDVMEVLGQRLAPIVQKAATWMENFSESVEKNGSILGALKEKLRETWDGMGTLGKAVVGLSGTFLVLKTAGTAWTLFTKVVHASKDIFTNVFRAITSWPAIIAGAAFMLYVAWEKNWFGIRDVVLEAWVSMKAGWSGAWNNLKSIWEDPDLSFFDKAMGSLGLVARQTVNGLVAGWVDTYATFRDVWTDPDISFWEKFVTTISKSVKDTTTGLVNGWKEAYDSYDAIWSDSNISVVEKFATSIGQVARDIADGIKLGWDDTYNTFSDIWGDKSLSVVEQFSATVLKFTRDTWDGLKEGWTGSYKDFSQIWGEANLSFWEKSMATISAGIKRIWEGGEGTPGLFSVFSDAWNNLTTIWSDPDLSFWNKVWETLLQGPHLLFDAIQSVGANLVAFFGGDSQKFLDTTSSALEGIKAKLKEIQEADSIDKKISIGVDLLGDFYEIPAKFVISGFVDNFDQTWIDNALNSLAVVGITKFLGGTWRMSIGLALMADVIFGDDVSSDSLVNTMAKSLEAGTATWLLTKSGTLGLGVSLVVMGWEAGKDFGEWLVSIGIGDIWDKWMKDTLGDFYTDTISGLKTDSFLDQLNASGIYMGFTILAGLKWPFDKLLDFTDWIGSAVNRALLGIYEAGLEIGNQLLDAIKYVFGGGWLLEMLGVDIGRTPPIDTSPGRSSGGRGGDMPTIGGDGEGLRFKDNQSRRFTGLEGMYAMEGFPSSGIEIVASPLTLDIRKEIDAVLKKAVAFVDQQQTSPIEKLK